MASKSRKVEDPDYNDGKRKRGAKGGKDPNAPKRPLSAFFCFSNEERQKVKAKFPDYTVGQIAKELGERWKTTNRAKYEGLAAKEKQRYEEEMAEYRQNGAKKAPSKGAPAPKAPAGKGKPAARSSKPQQSKKAKVDDDDDEEDVDEDEEDEEESD